ncbi:tail fiber assembly protein [Proteus sp. G2615]|uniref:tail fiber assembly protein n=1 Tax=Proteus sp. G2615 TaxID=2698845 RepID=UPI00137659BE|nr:tail fiber assembly protein [Proteus sp. G2615]NBN73390.1 tail fiber assembly protein [Proteus sp. G2615]
MEKYSLEVQQGKIGSNGFAEVAGWVKCYLIDSITREYLGASMENVRFDVSLPAGAYPDEPKLPKKERQAIRRNEDGDAWELVDDFRGLTAYIIETKQPVIVDFMGKLPEAVTLLEPVGEFDVWNGKKWVVDETALKNSQVNAVIAQKEALSTEAENRIVQLDRKVRLDMASDEEKDLLTAWEIYTVILDEINPELAPDIEWPEKPQ